MVKRKIRLTESQLIDLIKKSMVSEQSTPQLGSPQLPYNDSQLKSDVNKIVSAIDGYSDAADYRIIHTALKKYVGKWAKSEEEGKIVPAIKRISELYEIDESGDSLYDDLEAEGTSSYGTEVQQRMEQCKTWVYEANAQEPIPANDPTINPAPTPAPVNTTQENKFYCLEGDGYRAYGPAGKQYGQVQWKGGTLEFYLDASKLGDAGYPNDNILYQKGGKKWTTEAYCSEGGPGKPRGLIIDKPWNPKK